LSYSSPHVTRKNPLGIQRFELGMVESKVESEAMSVMKQKKGKKV
jgi:hypothetical protein